MPSHSGQPSKKKMSAALPRIERELGVPIPGDILPQDQWVQTALKHLPEKGYLDPEGLFGRKAPLVVDLGWHRSIFSGKRLVQIASGPHCRRFPAGRYSLRNPSRQPKRPR